MTIYDYAEQTDCTQSALLQYARVLGIPPVRSGRELMPTEVDLLDELVSRLANYKLDHDIAQLARSLRREYGQQLNDHSV
jgi:hypothetical protein